MIIYKDVSKSDMEVTWEWYDKPNGDIKWTFANNTDTQKSCVLLRNGYYFGNAFWPVYYANAQFKEKFALKAEPLADESTQSNSPPLFVGEVNGKYIVAFLFTLSAGQEWSMIEGGFMDGVEPQGISLHDVTSMDVRHMCIGYDEKQVSDWDQQTDTTLKGYTPNPESMDVLVGTIGGAYIQLFDDPISVGDCESSKPAPNCDGEFNTAIAAFQSGNIYNGIKDFMDFIDCKFHIGTEKDDIFEAIKHRL